MKDYSKLLKIVDELNSEFIAIWESVCNIESPTECKQGVDKVGNYFAEYAGLGCRNI